MMAKRPIFIPAPRKSDLVQVLPVEFKWHPGLSLSQKQKSIHSLHSTAAEKNISTNPLEVSTKSTNPTGIALSAFSLSFTTSPSKQTVSVESAFQGSKVFKNGGPFHQIYRMDPRSAKAFFKERNLGDVIHFDFFGDIWPNTPLTLFYNWIYIKTLLLNNDLSRMVLAYDCFTDIEFNPKKSFNCQAYAVALFVALHKSNNLHCFNDRNDFITLFAQLPDWRQDALDQKKMEQPKQKSFL